MIQRRKVFNIPEFYVGSVLAVTMADPHASGKTNCFVGVCIQRGGHGLGATFVLRNNIDGQGMEICYELYSLKLEKRLDNTLMYPRDALPEYSTVDLDMKPVPHSVTGDVPVNKVAGSDYCLTLPLTRLNTHFGSSLLYQSAYVSEASDGSGPSTMSRSSACCCPLRTLAGVRHHRPGGTHTQGGANVPQTPHPDPLSQPGVCSSGNRWAADSFKTVNDVESNQKYFIHSMSN